VASHHLPHEPDSKTIEFEYAKNGMTSLETTYPVLNMLTGITQEQIVSLLSVNPRKLFGLPPLEIKEGALAVLTLFDPDLTWVVSNSALASRSKNTPLLGKEVRGKAIGIINGSKITLAVFKS
jgi:dihydroorotase